MRRIESLFQRLLGPRDFLNESMERQRSIFISVSIPLIAIGDSGMEKKKSHYGICGIYCG